MLVINTDYCNLLSQTKCSFNGSYYCMCLCGVDGCVCMCDCLFSIVWSFPFISLSWFNFIAPNAWLPQKLLTLIQTPDLRADSKSWFFHCWDCYWISEGFVFMYQKQLWWKSRCLMGNLVFTWKGDFRCTMFNQHLRQSSGDYRAGFNPL